MASLSYIQTHSSPFTQTVPSLIILLALLQAHNQPSQGNGHTASWIFKGPCSQKKIVFRSLSAT